MGRELSASASVWTTQALKARHRVRSLLRTNKAQARLSCVTNLELPRNQVMLLCKNQRLVMALTLAEPLACYRVDCSLAKGDGHDMEVCSCCRSRTGSRNRGGRASIRLSSWV